MLLFNKMRFRASLACLFSLQLMGTDDTSLTLTLTDWRAKVGTIFRRYPTFFMLLCCFLTTPCSTNNRFVRQFTVRQSAWELNSSKNAVLLPFNMKSYWLFYLQFPLYICLNQWTQAKEMTQQKCNVPSFWYLLCIIHKQICQINKHVCMFWCFWKVPLCSEFVPLFLFEKERYKKA